MFSEILSVLLCCTIYKVVISKQDLFFIKMRVLRGCVVATTMLCTLKYILNSLVSKNTGPEILFF